MARRPRILLLFSDTGGGHRSAAEAIIEALEKHHPNSCETHLVDVFKEYFPRPFDSLPHAYPYMARVPRAWEIGYRLLDGKRRGRALNAAVWPYIRSHVSQLAQEQPADLIVSAHPLLIEPVLKALGKERPPFIAVVTDLISAPSLWFQRQVDLTVVPTKQAQRLAVGYGLQPERVQVIGLPVGLRFSQPAGEVAKLRQELGWPQDLPVVLLVGGAEGMGPIYPTARAIARQGPGFALAVVSGRNQALRRRLQGVDWEVPTTVYGFERRMPQMMQAADLLVTKAGSLTITESLNVGLPMVLYSRIPGQEDGNVDYVVEEGVGSWAPSPSLTAAAVKRWLQSPGRLATARETCLRIARPQAAEIVANLLVVYLEGGEAAKSGLKGRTTAGWRNSSATDGIRNLR